jgi:hypothetical protein
MSYYIELAKRLIKSCFPEVIPVTQLEPLDAKNIIKHRLYQEAYQEACEEASKYPCERWKQNYGAHMNVSFKPKPISDEEAWALTVAWAEVKAQERETKAVSQTDTDESYDSDDSEFGVPTHPVDRRAMDWSFLFAGFDTDEDEDNDDNEDNDDDDIEKFARTAWEQIAAMIAIWGAKERAATIIQAAARGRAVRLVAWFAALDAVLLMRVRVRKERRCAAKETKQAWKAVNDPTTWYRV